MKKFLKNFGKAILIAITVIVSIWAIPIAGPLWGGSTIKLITEI